MSPGSAWYQGRCWKLSCAGRMREQQPLVLAREHLGWVFWVGSRWAHTVVADLGLVWDTELGELVLTSSALESHNRETVGHSRARSGDRQVLCP